MHNLLDKPKLPESLLFINAHLSCCDKEDKRQKQVKALREFIRSAQKDGGKLSLSPNTPIVIAGDFNLVGKQETLTMLKSRTTGEPTFNQLNSVKGRITNSLMTYTWENTESQWPAGKLDYVFYPKNELKVLKSFTLNTANVRDTILRSSSLTDSTTQLASDHFPLVADFSLKEFRPLQDQDLWLSPLVIDSTLKLLTNKPIDSVEVVNLKAKTVYEKTFENQRDTASAFSLPLKISPGIYKLIWFSDKEKGYKQFMVNPE